MRMQIFQHVSAYEAQARMNAWIAANPRIRVLNIIHQVPVISGAHGTLGPGFGAHQRMHVGTYRSTSVVEHVLTVLYEGEEGFMDTEGNQYYLIQGVGGREL